MAKIMVVEDEPVTAADLEQRLSDLGHEVTWVDTGEEAVEEAAAHAHDLVLMDIRLRRDMSGINAAQRLRASSDVPIVFLTAFADPQTVERACATLPHGYLVKPFTERSVATAVQVALARAQAERAQRERERWTELAAHSAGEALIAVDEHAAVRFVNARAEELLQVRASDMLGRDARTLLRFGRDESDGSTHPLDLALESQRVTTGRERALQRVRGGSVLVSYSTMPVHARSGSKRGAVMVFHEKASSGDAVAEGALVAMDELSRRLAHEINNPLAYNLGGLELALDELDELRARSSLDSAAANAERERQLLEISAMLRDAREGATRVASVVRELGSFALAERDATPLNPRELLELAIGVHRIELVERVKVVREIAAAPMVRGNKWQLASVIAYALRSGCAALEASHAQSTTLTLSLGSDARGWASVRVSARTAPPAPAAPVSPSARTTTVSTQLAERVIARHGGELRRSDEAGTWAMELLLPPLRLGEGPRGSVLVVCEDPSFGRALGIVLQPEHDVTAVASTEAALELLARADAFDLVVVKSSPAGTSAHDFLARLRVNAPEVAARVVFIAGEENHASLLPGPCLREPFSSEELLSLVSERVRARAATRGAD